MENKIIKVHNFEIAKKKIQRFSNNVPTNLTLPTFEKDGGLFGWGDHKVTGNEMNDFVGKIQNIFINSNESIRSIITEFREVYSAFESLDKDYIQAIIVSVKAAETASSQAKDAQKDIRRTIDGLEMTINVLKKFKEKITIDINRIQNDVQFVKELFSHSSDVATIWKDIQHHTVDLKNLHEQLSAFIEKTNNSAKRITNETNILQQYRTKLEAYVHLDDIDTIWDDVQNHMTDLTNLHEQLSALIKVTNNSTERIVSEIYILQQYRNKLEAYAHLGDIDLIWDDVQNHTVDLTNLHEQLFALIEETNNSTKKIASEIFALQQYRNKLELYAHLSDIDIIWNDIQNHTVDLANSHEQLSAYNERLNLATQKLSMNINSLEKKRESDKHQLTKKIKVSYVIASSALIITITQFILNIMGLI